MGFLDEFGKALKKAGDEVRNSGIDREIRKGEGGPGGAGRDISAKAGGTPGPAQPAPAGSQPRRPHPGYAKIAAWMKRKYGDRIAGTSADQRGLQLEQISAEASAGLSAKAKHGFLEYLKKQNYEPLLK